MAVTNGWGQGVENNTINWGKGKDNATNNWGKIYETSASGDTALAVSTPSFSNTKSLDFDGVDDYVNTSAGINGTDWSISYWIKTSSATTNFQWYNPTSAQTNATFEGLYMRQNSGLKVATKYSGSGSATYGSTDLGDGNWHNVIATFNNTSQAFKVYVDGNTTPEIDVTLTSWAQFNKTFILGGTTSSLYLYVGKLDEVMVTHSILTTSDVTAIYNSGTPTDLASYSPVIWFRNGDGDTFPTLTDNGSGSTNGTMTNMVSGDIVTDTP